MPFTSMILPRTLSTGHAWLSKRVGRSKNRQCSQKFEVDRGYRIGPADVPFSTAEGCRAGATDFGGRVFHVAIRVSMPSRKMIVWNRIAAK